MKQHQVTLYPYTVTTTIGKHKLMARNLSHAISQALYLAPESTIFSVLRDGDW